MKYPFTKKETNTEITKSKESTPDPEDIEKNVPPLLSSEGEDIPCIEALEPFVPPEQKSRFESNRKYFTISIYALCVITLSTAIIYMIMNLPATLGALRHLRDTLAPFLAAIFVAFILNPIVRFLEDVLFSRVFRLKAGNLRKFLAILLTYLIVLSVIAVALIYVVPQIGQSMVDLSPVLTNMYDTVVNFLSNAEVTYPDLDFQWIQERINEFLPNMMNYLTNFVSNIFPMIYTLSVNIVKILINILLSIVISCYMLFDKNHLAKNGKRLLYALFSEKKSDSFIQTSKECCQIFTSFVVGKSIDSLIIGILCLILMSILRLPYSLLLSVIVGITNMIPYFGPFIGAVPGILIFLFIDPVKAVIFAAMILVLQQFDGLILGPKILGESTGLKPLWVIFAITIGGAYAGVIGMFLGVPVVGVLSYLIRKFIVSKLTKKNRTDLLD